MYYKTIFSVLLLTLLSQVNAHATANPNKALSGSYFMTSIRICKYFLDYLLKLII